MTKLMTPCKLLAPASFALILLAACGTSWNDEPLLSTKDINYRDTGIVHGIVRSVDRTEERVAFRRSLSIDRGDGSTATVEYTPSTPVMYNGQQYNAADLRPGDEVDIHTIDLGTGRVGSRAITVTRRANEVAADRAQSSLGPLSTVRGTVRATDALNRTIELINLTWSPTGQPESSAIVVVHYDANLTVTDKGQVHSMTFLRNGDVVDVQVRGIGANYLAQSVTLVSGGSGR